MSKTPTPQTNVAPTRSGRCPLFLHLKSCRLGANELKKIRAAGYIPIAVETFDSVKVVEPLLLGTADEIAKAAYATIAASEWGSVQSDFGKLVARALSK